MKFFKILGKLIFAFFTTWGLLELLGLWIAFLSKISTFATALLMTLGTAAIIFLYKRERDIVSRRYGTLLLALRIISFIIVCFILLEPTYQSTIKRRIERTVAVVFDKSGSMTFTDTEFSPSERLSLAIEKGLIEAKELPLPSLEELGTQLNILLPWVKTSATHEKMPRQFRLILTKTREEARSLKKELAKASEDGINAQGIQTLEKTLTDRLIPKLEGLSQNVSYADLGALIEETITMLKEMRLTINEAFYASLPPEIVTKIEDATSTNRLSLAISLYTNSLSKLERDYNVAFYSLGRNLKQETLSSLALTEPAKEESTATSFATSLEELQGQIPSEELAGVILISDGIDNSDISVTPVSRLFGTKSVPVSSVLIGSQKPPRDLAIADISAPESIFLGDKVRIKTKVLATNAQGTNLVVSLVHKGEKVDSHTLPISEPHFIRELSLTHSPTNNGLNQYTIEIGEIDNERFASNNTWQVDVAVSDDRTNVLLVDDYPRWDFRYLRNLFFARDKSVHLQYYLLHPDSVADIVTTNSLPPASASRPFGDAEAGALPENEEEWRKFDAIILGDVGPDVITPEIQKIIENCVTTRGALLVTIAGSRAMPHSYREDSTLYSLLPILPAKEPGKDYFLREEQPLTVTLTPMGTIHPIMQQSASAAENLELWNGVQPLSWVYSPGGIKPGADLIAYAKRPYTEQKSINAQNAAELLDEEQLQKEQNSLIVAHNLGRGKVLSLNTDESWRLRYRVGDKIHHRFWGQIIRWGLGERLRSGTHQLRIGTEKLSYTKNESVVVLARILDKNLNPLTKESPYAIIKHLDEKGEKTGGALRIKLSFDQDSNGIYKAVLPPLGDLGGYSMEIEDPHRYTKLNDGEKAPETVFFITKESRPIEMGNVAATPKFLETMAKYSHGAVKEPCNAKELISTFGEKRRTIEEAIEWTIWDSKYLLLLLSATLVAEWILRKRGGLV